MAAISAFLLQHDNLVKHTMFLHSPYCTSGRSMVVGHVPMVHTCTNHIDVTAHTPAFLRVGKHSGMEAFFPVGLELPSQRTMSPRLYPFDHATNIYKETFINIYLYLLRFRSNQGCTSGRVTYSRQSTPASTLHASSHPRRPCAAAHPVTRGSNHVVDRYVVIVTRLL